MGCMRCVGLSFKRNMVHIKHKRGQLVQVIWHFLTKPRPLDIYTLLPQHYDTIVKHASEV